MQPETKFEFGTPALSKVSNSFGRKVSVIHVASFSGVPFAVMTLHFFSSLPRFHQRFMPEFLL